MLNNVLCFSAVKVRSEQGMDQPDPTKENWPRICPILHTGFFNLYWISGSLSQSASALCPWSLSEYLFHTLNFIPFHFTACAHSFFHSLVLPPFFFWLLISFFFCLLLYLFLSLSIVSAYAALNFPSHFPLAFLSPFVLYHPAFLLADVGNISGIFNWDYHENCYLSIFTSERAPLGVMTMTEQAWNMQG